MNMSLSRTPNLSTRRAAVVEDSRTVRTLLRGILQNAGFEVSEATTGFDALPLVLRGHFDLVVLDCNLPGLGGHEILRLVRARTLDAQPRVLMVSTASETERMGLALSQGADGYVTKPLTQHALREQLARLGFP